MNKINRDLESELQSHLDQDEKILWTGIPKQGLSFQRIDAFIIPFSLLWGGLAFFGLFNSVATGAPMLFILISLFFSIAGLYIIIGRFIFDIQRRKHSIYGLTNKRIIIESGIFSKTIQTLNLRTISDVTLQEKPDGSGTIILGQEIFFTGMYRGTGWPGSTKVAPSLEGIPDATKVYKQIMDLQSIN